jgi:hypothetical protein
MSDRSRTNALDKMLAKLGDRVAEVHDVLFGSDDYCRCARPITDFEAGLDTAEQWCWRPSCLKPLDPTTLTQRVVAFLA